MKKNLLIILFVFFAFSHHVYSEITLPAESSLYTREKALSLPGGHHLYFFSDGSVAYLLCPPYEDWTLTEWWNGTPHEQPDPQFFFKLEHWKSGNSYRISVFDWDTTESTLSFISRKTAREYPYMIQNTETGQITLCQIFTIDELAEFIERYGKERFDCGIASAPVQ